MIELLAKAALSLIETFIANKATQEEWKRGVLREASKYNAGALDSARLRAEYDRLCREQDSPEKK